MLPSVFIRLCEGVRVRSAAIRYKGVTYEDDTHYGAQRQMMDAYGIWCDDEDAFSDWVCQHEGEIEDGFVLSDGRFVSREEALNVARKERQFHGTGEAWANEIGYLHAEDLNPGSFAAV